MKKRYLLLTLLFVAISLLFFTCKKEVNSEDDVIIENLDSISVEVVEFIDNLPIENLSRTDLTLENGNYIVDFLMEYDYEFVQENPWILEFNDIVDDTLGDKHRCVNNRATRYITGGITGNAGIINLKNTVITEMVGGCSHFMNDAQGIPTSRIIREKIADQNQRGLWYKYNGKRWDEYSYGMTEPRDGIKKKCYGLDCSGLVYSGMNRIGFAVPIRKVSDYYNVSIWQNALRSFLAKKTNFPDEIKDNLKFEKYEYSVNEFPSKTQMGDIVFCYKGGSTTHMGLVTGGKNVAQSNGLQFPPTAEDNYKNGKRGPHLISAIGLTSQGEHGFNFTKFGVIRLVPILNDTHWRLNIKCEGQDTYITSFDIEIKMSEVTQGEITITPVQTIGYDYDGDMCDVYFTGSFNPETQILKGSVTKTYPSSTRTDGFEVKLTDDNIYDIEEYRIVSNGACTNYLDLENIDNTSRNKSAHKKINLNTIKSVVKNGDCTDSSVN